jgi:cyanate permease
MGGQVGPAIMGKLKEETHGFTAGTLALAGFLLVAATIARLLSRRVRQEREMTADL